MKSISILLFFLSFWQAGRTQGTLQVATKSIEKRYDQVAQIELSAEKGDVEIQSWSKDEVKVVISLIAKHPDRKVAASDLELMQYAVSLDGKKLTLRNFLVLKNSNQKPESNLKAKFTLFVPQALMIELENSFGKINATGKYETLKISTEFCSIELLDIDAKLDLNTKFGQVNGRKLSKSINIKSNRSDLVLSDLSGSINLKTQYGTLKIQSLKQVDALLIDAQKTTVDLVDVALKNHQFRLLTSFGNLNVPSVFSIDKSNKNKMEASLNTQLKSKIQVQNSFGDISVK